MDNIRKKILEAFTRDGILEEKAYTLQEYDERYPDDLWEYKTIEEFLADQYELEEEEESLLKEDLKGDQNRQFEIGDIIFTNAFYSPSSHKVVRGSSHSLGTRGHKIIVITSNKDIDGIVRYTGFVLTSNADNSNKMGGYSNKLYISDYSTIVQSGPKISKPAAVNVNDLVKFNSKDLSSSGTYKGHVTDEFLNFLQIGYNNYKSHKDNSKYYWER